MSLSIVPDSNAKLRRDAERLEALFALAAEEAQLSSHPLAWRGDEKGYAFYRRERNEWVPLSRDAEFKARTWDVAPMRITLAASDVERWATGAFGHAGNGFGGADDGSTAIQFPRDGAQVAFELTLEADGKTVVLKADGGGHYQVEPGA